MKRREKNLTLWLILELIIDADPLATLQVRMAGMKLVENRRKPKQYASKWEQLKFKIHFLPHCKHNAPKLRRHLF